MTPDDPPRALPAALDDLWRVLATEPALAAALAPAAATTTTVAPRSSTPWSASVRADRCSAALRAAHERRRVLGLPERAWPTELVSVAARAAAISALAPRSVWINEDVDGLPLGLSGSTVAVAATPEWAAPWLAAELAAAAPDATLDPCARGPFDVAVVSLASPEQAAPELERARAMATAGAGARVVASVRPVAEAAVYAAARLLGLVVERHWRDVEHYLLPAAGGVDDGGSLLVLRPGPPMPENDADRIVTGRPALALDAHGLALDAPAGALRDLCDLLALYAPRPEARRRLHAEEGREAFAWFDEEGCGCVATFAREEGRLTMELLPYEARLDYALRAAVAHVLGTPYTRFRAYDVLLPTLRYRPVGPPP